MTPVLLPGIDALRAGLLPEELTFLQGRRLGLLTNHTGAARDGASTLAVLQELNLDVVALFSPEHGFSGIREGHIESSEHDNLPVHSLYGETRRPTGEMLSGIEILICDLQDVGARFYTYASTLAYCLEECAKHGVAVLVLDRPNPLGGDIIEGPLCDEAHRSFVGYLDVPIRHGLTMGELALLHKHDKALEMELRVARVLNWQRTMLWPETNLKWPMPSPNLPDWESALWYPGICLLEFSGVSVGRGTEAPFQIVGAPWLDGKRVLAAMQDWPGEVLENFTAQEIEFTPTRGEYSGTLCRGMHFQNRQSAIGNRQSVVPLGLCLLSTLHATHPQEFHEEKLRASLPLLGSGEVLELLRLGEIEAATQATSHDAEKFRARRTNFLIYKK